jgi:hypothetical protein
MNENYLKLLSPYQDDFFITQNEEITSLERLAIRHNTWMLLYCSLRTKVGKKEEGAGVIQDYLAKNKTSFLNLAVRSIKQQAEQNRIIDSLSNHSIPAIVIKGTALAHDVYHNENSRFSYDIDLLVKERDIFAVHDVLIGNGFRRTDHLPLPFSLLRIHHTSYASIKQERNVPLEVHWNFSIPGFFQLASQDIWAEARVDEHNRYALSPDMTLILLLMHHHRHAFREFRNIVDLLWAFYRYDQVIDWGMFAAKINAINLVNTSHISVRQVEELWPQEAARLQGLQLFKKKIRKSARSVYLTKRLTHKATIYNDQSFTLTDKIVYRLALDRWQTIAASFWKSFFPSPQAIKKLTIENGPSNIVLNYLRYFYWRFFKTTLMP